MSVRNLDRIFKPKQVALVGGNLLEPGMAFEILGNLLDSDLEQVFAVRPFGGAAQGVREYSSIAALPVVPDLAVICTHPDGVPGAVRECGEAG
jgi:acetyltransferase